MAIGRDYDWQDVYGFWFPDTLVDPDHDMLVDMTVWWMQGGASAQLEPFRPIVEAAIRGELNHWCETPEGRLSLIIVLDQFTRGLFAGTPRAYASDPAALALAEDGIRSGEHAKLATAWEQTFFEMPLGHTEGPGHLERMDFLVGAAEARLAAAPPHLKRFFEFAVGQPRDSRVVIERFGRYPHRNEVLGRPSTPDEQAYIEKGDFVHRRRPRR